MIDNIHRCKSGTGVWFIRIFPDFRIFCDQNFRNSIDFQPDFVCFSPLLRYFTGFFVAFRIFPEKLITPLVGLQGNISKLKENQVSLWTLHNKTPHVVTVLWQDSDDVVTILSPTSGTSGRLQNRVPVPPWFLHSDYM